METHLSQHNLEKMAHFLSCPAKRRQRAHAPAAIIPDPTLALVAGYLKLTCMFRHLAHFSLMAYTYDCNCSFEAQINTTTWQGEASQSFQIAPFDAEYQFNEAGINIYDSSNSEMNTYKGGAYQQAVSVLSNVPNTSYGGSGWVTLGFELWGNSNDRQNSYITWYVNGAPVWTAYPSSVGADTTTEIGARLISEEPMVSRLA
jgi:hypothetical protein